MDTINIQFLLCSVNTGKIGQVTLSFYLNQIITELIRRTLLFFGFENLSQCVFVYDFILEGSFYEKTIYF